MTFGLTSLGFNQMRLADIKQFLENAFIAEFGQINIDPQSVFGQEIGTLSKVFADIWENLSNVYFSQYPNSASGISLDNVVALNGLVRLPQTQTRVTATLNGLEGTSIPAGALASIPATGAAFFNESTGFITNGNADQVIVSVLAVAAHVYNVVLSNQTFSYSYPIITFSNTGAIFQAGQTITVNINGIDLAGVPFTTDSNTTLGLVAAAIQAFNGGLSCTAVATNPNIISITPLIGFNIEVGQILITGPGTIATNVKTFAAPPNINHITQFLTAIINNGVFSWTAIDNVNGTFSINANDPSIPFSVSVGQDLSITYVASPFTFLSEEFGPIPAPVNSLTQIDSPIAGWNGITNLVAGQLGRFIETDAQLRIRRQNSIKLAGNATVEAIQAKLLQLVPGVTSAIVLENSSATEVSIVAIFPLVFTNADIITFTYNTSFSFTVTAGAVQATTMAAIVNAFELLPQVLSATHGGTGDKTLTINFKPFQTFTLNSAIVTTGVSQTAAISGGRPPKSFEAIVEGGTNFAVATEIWLTKPAGIETFGNTSQVIVDSQGNNQTIFFTRPNAVFIWVTAVLTLNSQETFPVNGINLVKANLNTYGNSLGVGIDVFIQRMEAQVFIVPGIASVVMQLASTPLISDSPVYSSSDIIIGESQIAVFDESRIFVTVV